MNKYTGHVPVLLNEVIEGLNIKEDGIYVDCTMGGAGHASNILQKIKKGWLYCFEQDPSTYQKGQERLAGISTSVTIFPLNFEEIKSALASVNVTKVDGILYDLGVSSFQLDTPERGFSYNTDSQLDMRMNTNQTLTAKTIVNEYSFNELRNIFSSYGEEKFSTKIARMIEKQRQVKPIETTLELVEIIKKALPAKVLRQKGHPAKQVFQALRIAVNDELNVFKRSLRDALEMLNPHGRIAVITFHSLEDKICKKMFMDKVSVNIPKDLPVKDSEIVREYRLVNTRAIIATEKELSENHRSHSAKLRIIEKL